MANILIIYTGGTIGMVADPVTGALKPLDFSELENEIPALKQLGVEISPYEDFQPIDSSDVTPADWVGLAEVIARNHDSYDGFVVLHGTDTMAWTASALSFMLDGLAKPVVFTGSQIPIGVLRTDGRENLVTAVEIAAATPVVPEVSIYFQNRLFRANRTTKWSAEQLNAFTSENHPPLAEVGVTIHYNREHILGSGRNFHLRTGLCSDVALLRLFPGMRREVMEATLGVEGLRGVVLQTFGAGNTPTAGWFFDVLERAIAGGIVVLNVTQCIAGGVSPLYESGVELSRLGVVSGRDMTLEAAMTKLMWVLGRNLPHNETVRLLETPLRGEMS